MVMQTCVIEPGSVYFARSLISCKDVTTSTVVDINYMKELCVYFMFTIVNDVSHKSQ